VWDENAKEWEVDLVQPRKDEAPRVLSIRSSFVSFTTGVLNWPKLLGIPGILDYQGDMFHSSRWAYIITGGTPEDASLVKLKDKQVAVIDTGAISVQIVPQLARWCKYVYVIQRTPAAVDDRDQRATNEEWFHKEVAGFKGWQYG
jgi:cation diffusion facilitator CzcD-associated flavoprotein CzcO